MNRATLFGGMLLLVATSGAWAETEAAAEPQIKVLAAPQDPTKEAVLIGRTISDGLTLQLELEGAEAMWMPMGTPAQWSEHVPAKDERYHIEFKATDNATKTRLPYSTVTFTATNKDNGKSVEVILPPMWGSSGLHYSENSALAGDGVYAATVTVDVPTFSREMKDKDLWSKPVSARFHFRLKDGMLVEVSETLPAGK